MDRKRIAKTGASAVLKMIMIDGLFHADPHPGNFFILPGERIAFIDFGMIGRVSELRRRQITKLLQALLENDAEGLPRFCWNGLTEKETTRGTDRSR